MMGGPTGATILDLYEAGMGASAKERTALLCQAGGGEPQALPLGDVDRHIWSFLTTLSRGPQDAFCTCRACSQAVEFSLPGDFVPGEARGVSDVPVDFAGRTFRVRVPRLSDFGPAGLGLEALCRDAPWHEPAFVAAAETAMAATEPALDLALQLECAHCGAAQVLPMDVGAFAWERLEQVARKVIGEVARLARGYGWAESEITAMSAARRAIYLAELPQ